MTFCLSYRATKKSLKIPKYSMYERACVVVVIKQLCITTLSHALVIVIYVKILFHPFFFALK